MVVVVAALALFAYQHRDGLSAPDPTALIIGLRNQVQPFRYTLTTEPTDPSCDRPTSLVVHAVDSAGQPIDGLKMEADVSMAGSNHGVQEVKLKAKGHGNYEGRVTLEQAGSWDVDLAGEKDGRRARQKLTVDIGPARPGPHIDYSGEDDDDDS
jgi:hypothetical protein